MSANQLPPLAEIKVSEFLARLAGPVAAPGGGSAAALAAACAAGLVEMVAAVTLAKATAEEERNAMVRAGESGGRLRARLTGLIDEDTAAYARLSMAHRMPRNTEAERASRREAVQGALLGAISAPLAVAESCLELLHLAAETAGAANRLVAPDATMAGLLAEAALQGSLRNAAANLRELRDTATQAAMLAHAGELKTQGQAALAAVLQAADAQA